MAFISPAAIIVLGGAVVLLAGIVVVVLLLVNPRAVTRFFDAGSAQLGKAGRWAASQDPVAMYKEKIDDATDHIRTAKQGLVQVRGLIMGVQRQVDDGDKEAARLDARVKVALSGGDESRAAEYVRQLQETTKQLEENRRQLAVHQETYQGFLRQVQAAQAKVVQAKQDAEKIGVELQISKAEAELADIAENFQVNTSALDGLGAVKNEIHRQIDANRARGQVARDLSANAAAEVDEEERVKNEDAKVLLEQYKAQMGLKKS
jgi:phage shock protein A